MMEEVMSQQNLKLISTGKMHKFSFGNNVVDPRGNSA